MRHMFCILAIALFISSAAVYAEPGLIDCWYNNQSGYTGWSNAAPGTKKGQRYEPQSGDRVYAWTMEGKDGTSCPRRLPSALMEDTAPAKPGLITCWYNEKGKFTGSDSAAPGTKAGGPVRTGQSGDRTWSYTHEAKDGTTCPQTVPSPAPAKK